jgi:hypothetical protein
MLIETPYKVGDVVTIKLTSGEELVGKFEASDDTQIKINKPLTLFASEKGIGLQQFLFTADMAISYSIKHNAITLVHKTKFEFAEAYTKQTSSIVQAPAGMADLVRK